MLYEQSEPRQLLSAAPAKELEDCLENDFVFENPRG
jgi:hypothetical protein